MVPLILVCSALVAASPDDLASYRDAAAHAGRDADAHVRLALWCEARGLGTERLRHLAIAVLTDPAHASARGLMGLVAYRGKWHRPDVVSEKVKSDEGLAAALAEYNGRRARTPATADAHEALALWCEENGLKAEAMAHLAEAVRLDPSRERAWKRMGYRKHAGRWMTDDQVAAEKAEADAQKLANKHWKAQFERWRGWLGDRARQADAERALGDVTDPRAVPALLQTFGTGGAARQATAVRVLGQIDAPGSSRALAMMVVRAASADVRRAAVETLKRRDPREYLGFLIGMIVDPTRFEIRDFVEVTGPGTWETFRRIAIDGDRSRVVIESPRTPYSIAGAVPRRLATDDVPFEPAGVYPPMTPPWAFGGPMLDPATVGELERLAGAGHGGHPGAAGMDPATALVQSAMAASRMRDLQVYQAMIQAANRIANQPEAPSPQFDGIADNLEATDARVRRTNSQLYAALNDLTGEDLPADPETWRKKWYDIEGYSYTPRAKADQPKRYYFRVVSCFGAGTMVQALTGPRPIEALELGDRVLAQDVRTGGLEYRAVVAVHHNPPAETLRVKLGGEVVVSSVFHRFWKAGHGWVMARDLKPGDMIRSLGGIVPVETVAPGTVEPVFNLDVAEDHTFLVGRGGILVHDNTRPGLRETPFDAASAPGPAARPGP